ncbi:hypothetical protein [Actinotalea sp. Marseille-Q4924]|uniref:hypothetical protein n=1 Tax=Actinotalea sp. Marseille-Q4924 TaxID=2866571 RepID=UPI001CE463D5|nr:hypothetical protein [Actinotalea sp. Marseille-Q4924]
MAMHTAPHGALTQTTPNGTRWWWDGYQWHPLVPWPPRERRTVTLAAWSLGLGIAEVLGGMAIILALIGQGPEPTQPYVVGPIDAWLGALWVMPSIVLGFVVQARRPPTSNVRTFAVIGILAGIGTALVTVGVPLNLMWVAAN